MKFLHTSDWHLGASENLVDLKEDQKHFITNICGIISAENVDAVLLAGDVFDRSIVSPDAIRLYDWAMTKICRELGKQLLLIAGNHDGAERLSNCSRLLESSGLHILGAIEKEPSAVSFEDTQVFLLPWITEEKVKSIYPEESETIKNLTDAYQTVCDHMREKFEKGKKHIVLAHAFITKAETSGSDRAAEIGLATQVPARVFDGFDYVALGHIHKAQDVTDTIRYSGTPMPYSFGKEEQQEKSVTILDTSDMSRKIVKLDVLHPRKTLSGTLEEIMHPDVDEKIKNGYVCLKITDDYVGRESMELLKQIYPYPLEISGKSFQTENDTERLSLEEFREIENDPLEILKRYCREKTEFGNLDERRLHLFQQSMEDYYKEMEE